MFEEASKDCLSKGQTRPDSTVFGSGENSIESLSKPANLAICSISENEEEEVLSSTFKFFQDRFDVANKLFDNCSKLSNEFTELKTSAENQLEKISLIHNDVSGEGDKIASLISDAETKRSQIIEAEKEAQEKTKSILELQGKITNLTTNIQNFIPTADNSIKGLKDTILVMEKTEKQINSKFEDISNRISKLGVMEESVLTYEDKLKGMALDYEKTKSQIESLLSGATCANLAAGFEKQKHRFTFPIKMWTIIFVVALLTLFVMSIISYGSFFLKNTDHSWEETVRFLLHHIPIAGSLIWLALHSSKQKAQALRMQEEYSYKEAAATAFEGFKREMKEITTDPEGKLPITILCANLLRVLDERPGRIYEARHQETTPLTMITEAVQSILENKNIGKK